MSDEESRGSQGSQESQDSQQPSGSGADAELVEPAHPVVVTSLEEDVLLLEEGEYEAEDEECPYEEQVESDENPYGEVEEYEDEQESEEASLRGPLTEADIAECKEAFLLFDKNADGCIDAAELLDVLHSLSRTPSDKQVQRMMTEVIRRQDSGDGGIEFDDFIGMIERIVEERDTEEKVREAFQVFDKEKTGRVSASVLRQAMTSLCDCLTDEEVDHMIQERDLDDQGTVDIEQLVRQVCDIRLGAPHSECEELTPRAASTDATSDICD